MLEHTEFIKISSLYELKNTPKKLTSNEFADETVFAVETKKVPVTKINIIAPLVSKIAYNRVSKITSPENLKFKNAKLIELDEVQVFGNRIEKGIVYSPTLMNGEIVFKKNKALTQMRRKSERYKKRGLNKWGIDVNAKTWSEALRAHLRGKAIGLNPIFSCQNPASVLWVIDGVYSDAPKSDEISLLGPAIREVKVLEYSEATLYGVRGSAGVIVINTTESKPKHSMNYKKSFAVKGKKNRELMIEYKSFEKLFNEKIDSLKEKLKQTIANNQIVKTDSILEQLAKTQFKNKLFTANFVLNYSNYEIAPYLALTEIGDMDILILDSIASNLSPEVKLSKYGKKFTQLMNSKKNDLTKP